RALLPDSIRAALDSARAAADSAAALDSLAVDSTAAGRVLRAGRPSRDSVLAALRALSGYSFTEYTGTGARFASDSGQIQLLGKARITRGTEGMEADSLVTFSEGSGVVCGYGQPVLT